MKAKSLSFAFISFCELGLFNGLRQIQIKKFSQPPLGKKPETRHLVFHDRRGSGQFCQQEYLYQRLSLSATNCNKLPRVVLAPFARNASASPAPVRVRHFKGYARSD